MSVHISSMVWKLDVDMTTKIVLLKLADHAWDDGSNVFPKQSSVAADCGCCVRTVQRAIERAIELGILREAPSRRNQPNSYAFVVEALQPETDRKSYRQKVVPTESRTDSQSGPVTTHSQVQYDSVSQHIRNNHQGTVSKPSCESARDENLPEELLLLEPPVETKPWWSDRDDLAAKVGCAIDNIKPKGKPLFAPSEERLCNPIASKILSICPGLQEVDDELATFTAWYSKQKPGSYSDPYRCLRKWLTKVEPTWEALKRARARSGSGQFELPANKPASTQVSVAERERRWREGS